MNLMFGEKNKNEYLTWIKIVFGYLGIPKRILLISPPHFLIRHWSIDCYSLIFKENQAKKIDLQNYFWTCQILLLISIPFTSPPLRVKKIKNITKSKNMISKLKVKYIRAGMTPDKYSDMSKFGQVMPTGKNYTSLT